MYGLGIQPATIIQKLLFLPKAPTCFYLGYTFSHTSGYRPRNYFLYPQRYNQGGG
jgi:hypothetical protein